jgi:hypothetical protein
MPVSRAAYWLAEQVDQGVAGLLCGRIGAGLVAATGAIHFPGCYAGKPEARTLGAPNGAIAVVYRNWRAHEALSCGNREGEEDS